MTQNMHHRLVTVIYEECDKRHLIQKRARSPLLEDANYDLKKGRLEKHFESMLFKIFVIFPQITYQIVPYARDFLPIKIFFQVLL